MEATAIKDGGGVHQIIEQVAGYKDTVTRIRSALRGKSIVDAYRPEGDKVVRASPLEPIIDAGNFVLERAEWNEALISELRAFPNGGHDDQVDAVVISLGEELHGTSGGIIFGGNHGF